MSLEAPNVLPFRSRSDAPVAVLPRPHFGLRDALTPAERNAFDRSNVDPSLTASVAAQAEFLAGMAERLADTCRMIGAIKQAASFREMAHVAETNAAELELLS